MPAQVALAGQASAWPSPSDLEFRSFGDHLGELGERRRGREVKTWRSAVGSTRLIRPSTDTWWLELQQAWRPSDRREMPAEGRALVPRDRGIDSITCTGTQPSPQPH
ncbi:hypothetical protein mRhiFer1_003587 [Rhinolophus ferrumequinum]|uniref:Uncharacterized protein n=1 Tax=Rhinolophus ferrumequinum TaxID=59479 RepID=A0A7J7XN14_RHIFE|nr:hypothetical protein mRhiFer1_003587 [Rhinolophus ferrumequinum]